MLLVAAASVWLSAYSREALGDVQAERNIFGAAETVRLFLEQAETGQRGYILTGRDEYLTPFLNAEARLPAAVERMEMVSRTRPDVRVIVDQLIPIAHDKMAELRQTVDLSKAGQRDEAVRLLQTDRGQRDMDEIRARIGELAGRQSGIIARRFAEINRSDDWLIAIDTAGLLGLVVLCGVIAFGLRRHIATLKAAQAELAAANAELEAGRANLERAVEARTAELVEANEEIQRFAYIVSHDLRAPLVNVMGFTSELETAAKVLDRFLSSRQGAATPRDVTAAVEEDIPEAIRFIRGSTDKMDRLIAAILRLSREGRRVLTSEPIPLGELLGEISRGLQHQASEKETEIVIGELPTIWSDRLALEQIFANLVDNALKYLVPGRPGSIKVSGRVEREVAVIEVRDNGRGIATKDYDRVFELFRRAGDQTVPGEGIGLAHVSALVKRLGGRIECRSSLGEGSVFTVWLPLVAPHEWRHAA